MKTIGFLALLLAVGCAPMGVYYKPGAAVAASQRAEINCKVAAERKVPVRNVTRVIPGPITPPRKICNSEGRCRIKPGRELPPRIVTEDANEGLRRDVVMQCMADKGYRFVRIPQCSQGISQSVTPQQTTVYPRLGETSCVVRGSGVWQIVTPG
ncbi:hypothetical protein N4R57_09650 [Rhodobacteraceae bacterium D3-12]|nr:hypothetical protein N4R57_09650 [Rhodobacteraceae bacterium D3-12]